MAKTADTCPKCGAKNKRTKFSTIVFGGLFSVVVFGMVVGDGNNTTAQAKAKAAPLPEFYADKFNIMENNAANMSDLQFEEYAKTQRLGRVIWRAQIREVERDGDKCSVNLKFIKTSITADGFLDGVPCSEAINYEIDSIMTLEGRLKRVTEMLGSAYTRFEYPQAKLSN